MTLPTRPLGSSGLEITTVGFGAWATGGGGWAFGWGPQDDADSLAAMRRALELGINWIDTAAVYGLGHSEEVVGRLLRDLPSGERPLVFTKCGLVWDERDRMKEARRVLRPDSIRKECEASLRRLGVEQIDLYQFHWPDETGTPVEDSWQAMAGRGAAGPPRRGRGGGRAARGGGGAGGARRRPRGGGGGRREGRGAAGAPPRRSRGDRGRHLADRGRDGTGAARRRRRGRPL